MIMAKKHLVRIWMVIIIAWMMCFSDWSFAAEWDPIWSVAWVWTFMTSILSWIWVFFAKIAWEFLSNKWVYGEVLWIDTLLWQYRNIVKNIANFILGFYFLYVIFSSLIKKSWSIVQNVKNIIWWILVAWIWIQASWFMVGAVLDVSSVTFVAMGSLPHQVISLNPDLKNKVREVLSGSIGGIKEWQNISLFPQNEKAWKFLETIGNKNIIEYPTTGELMDSILPTNESLEWPLYFMWIGLLNAHETSWVNSKQDNTIKKTVIDILLQSWTTIVYSIEMMVLCVLAIMRVLYLWMFIVVSPLAVLVRCIKQSGQKLWWNWMFSFLDSFQKNINFKSFFINVFKPSIIALGISITVILVTLVKWALVGNSSNDNSKDLWWVTISSEKNNPIANQDSPSYNTSIESEWFSFYLYNAWKSILDILLSILAVILVYMIIKFAVKMWDGKDFVSEKIGNIQGWLDKIFTSMPLIPVAWYDNDGVKTTHYLSAGSALQIGTKKIEGYKRRVDDIYQNQESIIRGWFGNDTWYLSPEEMKKITNARNGTPSIWQLTEMKNAIAKNEKWKWMTLNPQTSSNNGFWINEFSAWLEWMKYKNVTWTKYNTEWNEMISRWNNSENTDKTLEKMFKSKGKENQHVKAYADFFGLNLSSNTWEELKKADISKK